MFLSQSGAESLQRSNASRLDKNRAELIALNHQWNTNRYWMSYSGYSAEKSRLEYRIFMAEEWLRKQN